MTDSGADTPAQLLALATRQGLARLDAQLLLLHTLERPLHDRAWLQAHDSDMLPTQLINVYETLVQRRLSGEPVAYITGEKEFFGLSLQVDARVLVPRPDTETLVEWALQALQSTTQARVVDLGTGSGAIALALKHSRPDLNVTAVDASSEALTVARANAKRLALDVELAQSNWLEGVSGKFDLIVSNPPYIALEDQHLSDLNHEPQQALTSGEDGLDDIRKIVAQAAPRLSKSGWLLLEHGYDQAETVRQLLHHAGFSQVQSRQDLNGIERCSGGRVNPNA